MTPRMVRPIEYEACISTSSILPNTGKALFVKRSVTLPIGWARKTRKDIDESSACPPVLQGIQPEKHPSSFCFSVSDFVTFSWFKQWMAPWSWQSSNGATTDACPRFCCSCPCFCCSCPCFCCSCPCFCCSSAFLCCRGTLFSIICTSFSSKMSFLCSACCSLGICYGSIIGYRPPQSSDSADPQEVSQPWCETLLGQNTYLSLIPTIWAQVVHSIQINVQ